MRIDVRRLVDVEIVSVAGALDLATTPRLRAVLAARLAEGRHDVVLDLDQVTLLDAGAVGAFVAVADRAERAGGRLRAIAARGLNLEVLGIAGVDKRLSAYDRPRDVLAEAGVEAGAHADSGAVPGDRHEPDPYEPSPRLARRWPGSRDITTHALLAAARLLAADAPERAELRRQAIEDNVALAQRLARRFKDRGEALEDLTQVALVGLVQAVDGYDPGRGCEFIGYATPTVLGEVRRYFRDKGWRIKVPRRLQELCLQVSRARTQLNQSMSAEPTPADLARHLKVPEGDVLEAIEVARHYQPASLSTAEGPEATLTTARALGSDDPGIEAVDNRESVRPLLAALPERERRILAMRFEAELTQSQIARELGISQMHVSRLLSKTLGQLRAQLTAPLT